jgi:hypothetical protein
MRKYLKKIKQGLVAVNWTLVVPGRLDPFDLFGYTWT